MKQYDVAADFFVDLQLQTKERKMVELSPSNHIFAFL